MSPRASTSLGASSAVVLLGAPPGHGPAIAGPLAARIDVAACLYAEGASPRILVTGIRRSSLDEVTPMVEGLLARAVPESALLVDPDGARTLTSLLRARDVFRITEILVVTNPFHMPRALFLARALGMQALGVPAPERELPRKRTRVLRLVLEGGALTRAVVDIAWIKLAAGDAKEPATPSR